MSQNITEEGIDLFFLLAHPKRRKFANTGGRMKKEKSDPKAEEQKPAPRTRLQEYGAVQSRVVDLVVSLATERIAIEDLKSGHKKLTTREQRIIGEKRKTIRELGKEIVAELQNLEVHEQVQLALQYPILGDLVTKSIRSMPSTK